MATSFNIATLTAAGGLFSQVMGKLDNLSIVLGYYSAALSDIGANNDYELGDLMANETYQIMDMIDVMTRRLEGTRYGSLPCPPCHTAGAVSVPSGWGTCPTGVIM